ncbi:MAG: DMT family transporter [Burkholderiaceae bacterium]|nr:DMT family transporter [Burkholderiaceae bacterium]
MPPATSKSADSLSVLDIVLLSFVSLGWGLSFPVMKLGLETYPPITFRALSIAIGIAALGIFLWMRGQSLKIRGSELKKLFAISQINLTAWQMGLLYGVILMGASRAAIVGYTMPVWAFVASILIYKAPINARGVTGVTLAAVAVGVLTLNDFAAFLNAPAGLVILLGAAISWGLGTALIRNTPLSISNESMAFWALICTVPAYLVLTYWFESHLWRWPDFTETWTILYGGLVTFSFCYIAWYRLSRRLPPLVSSLSIMLTPVIGVISSAVTIGEHVSGYDWLALALIIAAMSVVLLPAHVFGFKRH